MVHITFGLLVSVPTPGSQLPEVIANKARDKLPNSYYSQF